MGGTELKWFISAAGITESSILAAGITESFILAAGIPESFRLNCASGNISLAFHCF